jgi:large subunit ribosomal protein L14e
MYEIGRLCVKLVGRDANKKCVIVEILDDVYVMIDGETRRRKCNIRHLEPLDKVLEIKKSASHKDVVSAFKKLKIEIKETKPKESKKKTKKEEKK